MTKQLDAELARIFARFDINKDDHIDQNEFGLLLRALGENVPAENLSLHFEIIDTNDDGMVDFTEFSNWWLDFDN